MIFGGDSASVLYSEKNKMKNLSFIKSFIVALKGIFYGISGERNIKIQIAIGLGVLIISGLLRISKIEFIIILSVSFLVIILELINTSFEKLIDEITLEYHKGFGRIKDIMAGVVLLGVVLSVIVGFLILYKPLINLLKEVIPSFFVFIIIDLFFIFGIVFLGYYIRKMFR